MIDLSGFLTKYSIISEFLKAMIFIIAIILANILLNKFKRNMLKLVKTKRERSNLEIFSKILKYGINSILIVLFITTYFTSLTNLGIILGLFSAALGFALQKPITGIAAWIMVVLKRPFEIGDRVIIGNVKGDVIDITITHIYLREIGGISGGEEKSGRTIMIPNYLLFENNIVNYSLDNEYVLGEVVVSVTYESNLNKAIELCLKSARKFVEDYLKRNVKEPYIRVGFEPSGINLHVRFFAPFDILPEIKSNITKEIYEVFMKENDVEIAYPHTEVIFREKYSSK